MCTNVLGRQIVIYFMPNDITSPAAWGVAQTGGARMLLTATGEDYSQEDTLIEENDSGGFQETYSLGVKTANFNATANLRFDDLRLIAQVMGADEYDTPAETTPAEGDFIHVIRPSAQICNIWATVGMKKGDLIQTFPSVKFIGFEITGTTSPNHLTVQYTGIASDLETDSVIITSGVITGVADGPDKNAELVLYRNMVFKIADEGGSLTTIDSLLTTTTFSFQRSLLAEYTNTGGLAIEQPLEDGWPEATFTLNFRNVDAEHSGYFEDMKGQILKDVSFTATGSVIGAGTARTFIIEAFRVKVMSVTPAPFASPGKLTYDMVLKCLRDPDGGFAEPFQITSTNAGTAEFF